MACEVGKGDDFGGAIADFFPGEFSTRDIGADNVPFDVEAHDFHANGACSATLDFVFVAEEVHSCFAAAIVKIALDEDT